MALEGGQIVGGGYTLAEPRIAAMRDQAGIAIAGLADSARLTVTAGGMAVELTFTATRTGLYHIDVGAGSGTGTYRLGVRQDDYAANTTTTGSVTVGGSATGRIEAQYERDWFGVALAAATTYHFDLEGGTGSGSLTRPVLRGVYDATGTRVANPDAHADGSSRIVFAPTPDAHADGSSRIVFAPTKSGTYYASASGDGAATGHYRVTVMRMSDLVVETPAVSDSEPQPGRRSGFRRR